MAQLENEHWWYRARRTILEHAVDRFVGDTARALTIGVGATREAEMPAKRTRLVAIDRAPINPDCVEFSLATQADALALPFSDHAFDAVFIFDVLEHIDDDDLALKEIQRVLTPEGRLLITVPAFMLLYGRQDVVSEHKRRYRRAPLVRLLEGAGFDSRVRDLFQHRAVSTDRSDAAFSQSLPRKKRRHWSERLRYETSIAYRENARVLVLDRALCRGSCSAPLRHLHIVLRAPPLTSERR